VADDIASLVIKVDSKGVVKASKNLDGLTKGSGKAEKATGKASKAAKDGSKSYAMMAAKIGGAVLAYKAITGAANMFIENTVRQEQAMRQLEVAVKSTGGAAGMTAVELREMAAGLQQVTTFGDEAIMEMQAILLTFTKIGKETLPQTTEAVANLATRMGTDLKSAAIQLGKALNDPIANLSALSRSGIQFSKSQKAMVKELVESNRMVEAQKIILAELDTQFGGSARAARDTMGGALSALGNKFGDLFEASGKTSKAIADVINTFNSWIPSTTESEQALLDVAKANTILKIEIEDLTAAYDKAKIAQEEGAGWLTFQVTLDKEAAAAKNELASAQERFNAGVAKFKEMRGEDGEGGETKIERLAREAEEIAAAQVEIDAAKQLGASLHFGIMHQIESEAALRSQKLKDKDSKKRNKIEGAMWANTIGLMHSGSKKAFEIGKMAATAQALIKGKESVTSAYAAGMSTGGPWAPAIAVAYAATAAAAVAGQISALKNTSFGGGGSVSAGTAATIPSAAPSGAAEAPTGEGAASRQEVSITLNGAGYSKEDVRELIGQINEEVGDGVELVTA